MNSSNKGKKSKKLLLIGLDNAGKTSLLLSLQKNTNLLSYYSLKPTQGLNIVNFPDRDTLFNIWDFGGQEQFRKDYLQHLDEYLTEVDKLIFVIDVQDTERYEIALQYLVRIIESLKRIESNIDLSIFLHKFDPGLEKLPHFTDKNIALNIVNKIKKIVPPNFHYKMFKTSIYTVFQKSSMII
ncbi:MAG: GTP-binding protein [Candidatus Helarchaeota archaeon]|nr:GTP-binding protein [Candidatus Helarchaeota archaeon]